MIPSASTYSSISSKIEFTSSRSGRNTVNATDVVSISSGNDSENSGFPVKRFSHCITANEDVRSYRGRSSMYAGNLMS